MRAHLVIVVVGFLAVQGCIADTAKPGELGTDIRPEPAVLVIPTGGSATTTVRAFEKFTNDPADVAWSIGRVGAGLSIAEDTLFGLVYQGERLALPTRSNIRRYNVTLTGTVTSSFVISGDAGVTTITVVPAAPVP